MRITGPFYGEWHRIIKCIRCGDEMSNHQRMYSNGICPYCGLDDLSTICNTYNQIQRQVYYKKWFLGFIPIKVMRTIQIKKS